MRVSKVPTVILFVALCSIQSSTALQDVLDLVDEINNIMKATAFSTNRIPNELVINKFQDPQSVVGSIATDLNGVIRKIKEMKEDSNLRSIFGIIRNLNNVVSKMEGELNITEWGHRLEDRSWVIHSKFEQFVRLIEKGRRASLDSWRNFSANHLQRIPHLITQLEMEIFPSDEETGNAFELAHLSVDLENDYCKETSMMQYFFGHLIHAVAITEVKAMLMLSYKTMIQNLEYGSWVTQFLKLGQDFKEKLMTFITKMRSVMDIAPINLISCDPLDGTRIRDINYFEIEKLEQVSLFKYNNAFRSNDCNNAIQKDLVEFAEDQDRCSGILSDCKFSPWLRVCRLVSNPKRYDWIELEDGSYGRNFDSCPNGTLSEYKWVNNIFDAHCMCKCREAVRNWISVSPSQTDTDNNMVATGARFVREDNILHLQLKQGKLMPNGWIDPSTEGWVPLPKDPKLISISPSDKFYLPDVRLPLNQVVVGVQFTNEPGFSLAVYSASVNYATGQLGSSMSIVFPDISVYEELDFPRKNPIYTKPSSTKFWHKQWLRLQLSDWKDDAGQSMLPLFEGVAVETNPPLPISGFGLMYKGVEGYAGFISPKLFSIPYAKTLKKWVGKHLGLLLKEAE